MSEVIEDFIKAHPGLPENEAFEGFASQERIRSWLAADPTRRERLRREFARVWTQMDTEATTAGQTLVAPRAPVPPRGPEPVPVTTSAGPARHLKVLCSSCERTTVWAEGSRIRCRHCQHEYHDMLELVPVKQVGMFHYIFGEGAAGLLTVGGVLVLLALLYIAATRL